MKKNSEEKEETKNIISSNEEQNVEVKTSKKSVITAVLIIIVIIGAIIGTYIIKNNNSKENTFTSNNKTNENQSNVRDNTLKQVKVTNDFIKIREQANVESKVIGKVYENEIYTIINEFEKSNYGWLEIETANGIRGFIASKNGNTSYVERLEVVNNEETTTSEEKEENKTENNKPTTTKPNNNTSNKNNNSNNSTNNNSNNSNNQNSQNSSNNETTKPSDNNYEGNLKACLKTCDEGYVLKKPDEIDCYCEKIAPTTPSYITKNQVIYNQDGVLVKVKGLNFKTSRSDKIELEFYFENNSDVDKTIQLSRSNIYINNKQMPTMSFSPSLMPNTSANGVLIIYRDKLPNIGLTETDIKNIKLELAIMDWDGKFVSGSIKNKKYSGTISIDF